MALSEYRITICIRHTKVQNTKNRPLPLGNFPQFSCRSSQRKRSLSFMLIPGKHKYFSNVPTSFWSFLNFLLLKRGLREGCKTGFKVGNSGQNCAKLENLKMRLGLLKENSFKNSTGQIVFALTILWVTSWFLYYRCWQQCKYTQLHSHP